MRIFTLLFLLFWAASIASSQETRFVVTGTVVFAGKPVAEASVELRSAAGTPTLAVSTKSDDHGRFRFDRIPAGSYTLGATAVVTPAEKSVFVESLGAVRVAEGANTDVALELKPTDTTSSIRLIETVEIAADTSQPIEQVSKTVDAIGAQELRDRADITLVDSVRTIPGFRVQQLGGFGRTASIKTRGLRNQDTAILIDGVRFRDPGSITGDATPFLSDLTLTSVSRIEVLRGSGSSLYGTNAIGGTLDFQTPRPQSGVHGQVSGAGGGLGFGRFRGNLSYGTSDLGISGAISRTAYTKGVDGNDNAGNTNVQSRVDYNFGANTAVSGRLFISDANVRLNTSPETFGSLPPVGVVIDAREGGNFLADQDDPDSTQKSRFFTGQFSLVHIFNRWFRVSGNYQGLDTDRTNNDGPLGPGFQSAFTSKFGGTIHTANVSAVWTPNSSNTLKGGYEFEAERFRNDGSTPSGVDDFSTRANQRSNTLFAQHLITLFDDRLTLAAGARAQWFSFGRPTCSEANCPYDSFVLDDPPAAYTFDGSASYFIEQTATKVRAHVGNGYRVPSLYERFGSFFFFGSFSPQGNPELKPERSLGVDAGVDQFFADRKVKASFTWFYTRIKDEITYLPTSDFTAPVYYNFDRHYSRGLETSIDIKPTRSTDIFWSYTFTNSDVRNFVRPFAGPVFSRETRVYGVPNHQFSVVATQRFGRFWVSFDLLATSSYIAPVFNNTTFASYAYRFEGNRRGDLTAGYTFPLKKDRLSLRVFGTVENLFDHEYFENGFRTAGQHGRVGVNLSF